jgi:hypothetical protein
LQPHLIGVKIEQRRDELVGTVEKHLEEEFGESGREVVLLSN